MQKEELVEGDEANDLLPCAVCAASDERVVGSVPFLHVLNST